jgi:hypothetical protein
LKERIQGYELAAGEKVETLLEHTDKLLLSSTSSDYSLLLQSQVRHLSQAMTKQPRQAACLQ